MYRNGVNSAKFGHRTVMSAHNDHFTLFYAVNIARKVGLSLLNINLYHPLPTVAQF